MSGINIPVQLPLGISLREEARFENFILGENGLLYESLKSSAKGDGDPLIYIWGSLGSGRSHLLQAVCHEADSLYRHSVYLPMSELIAFDPSLFESLEQMDLVCIDDVECLVGHQAWEEAMFHLFNRLRAANVRLIVAASEPPARLNFSLKDLTSRLQWGLVFQIQPIQEDEKIETLKARANSRGFELSDDVLRFIMHHGKRDLTDLLRVLDQLDHASLSAHRRITVPFVKQVMEW